MSYQNLIIEKEGTLEIIFLNRPKVLNALNSELLKELENELDLIKDNPQIKVLIISGAGEKAFAAGADINEIKELDAIGAYNFAKRGHRIFNKIENLDIPVIAAVNGFALGGGCELALACDLRIASLKAKFGQPEINLGIIPGYGGTQRLTRLIGASKAKELIFTGDLITAEESLKLGLVNKVISDDLELIFEVKKLAEKLAEKPPLALKSAKEVINIGLELPLPYANNYEIEHFALVCGTLDKREGISAFLEKRTPKFIGK